MYRDVQFMGGIHDPGIAAQITSAFAGQGRLEDMAATGGTNRWLNEYWVGKIARPEMISCPVCCVASWTRATHTTGTLRAYGRLHPTLAKWLRIRNTQEWPDLYSYQPDLMRFFDRYLRDQRDNRWEATPPVRLSALEYGNPEGDIVNRAELEWPLKRTEYRRYHLHSSGKLVSDTPDDADSTVSYNAASGCTAFTYSFTEDMGTTGYFMAHLDVSCQGHEDMDIFVQIEKTDSHGWRKGSMELRPENTKVKALLLRMADWNTLPGAMGLLFHWGPDGWLRVSHGADKDEELSTEYQPYFKHREEGMKKLREGEVRSVDTGLRPCGMLWKAGDVLRFTVSGKPVIPFPIPGLRPAEIDNQGTHSTHFRGSYLVAPHLPY
ncbi:hypothetical protein LTS18_006084 [Coniosporium uncinatum]|uniref:Uncharacterized protein n=1 Tax=Coniosporium uncinatum TaxID=93489 RepID=A0ACC3DB57_9PEZI|nr:hypothetical protein LTS18_006084 [Coniosporium uncinatum]